MENTIYTIKNRSAGQVCYRIPEDGIRRVFAPGESKKIPYAELEKLTWQSGGREILANYLQIVDSKVLEDLGVHTEPEYYMDEAKVQELLAHGSLDAFLDALDFAPPGVIDLIKVYAVSMPLTDYDKRKALKNKTGFDVDTALKNIELERAEEANNTIQSTTGRRVQPKAEEKPVETGRRTTVSYKVIDKN